MISNAATLARSIADAVSALPDVRRLTGGDAIEVATQYPGGKVVGVRLGETVQVHLVARRVPLPPVGAAAARAARAVLARAGDDRPVEIFVDDLEEA